MERYGRDCRALGSLGYAQAAGVLAGEMSREQAVDVAQQGHRNYAKRQLTWFRREQEMHWLTGLGSDEVAVTEAFRLAEGFLGERSLIMEAMNYFEVFCLPEKLAIDTAALEKQVTL